MAWLSGYTTRKKLTVDQLKVDADLVDFPVLVKLTNDSQIGVGANADGFDVRFTSSDGTTLLKYERESWAVAAGVVNACLWVKVSAVSGTVDTDIYIYYRTTDTADGADPTNVWDANYKAVYHMKDITTSTINDSTSNVNHGTKVAANNPPEIDGKVAKGQDFIPTDQIRAIDSASLDLTEIFTLEILVKADDIITDQYIFTKGADYYTIILGFQDNYFNFYNRAYQPDAASTQIAAVVGEWAHIVYTKAANASAGNWKGYKNGTQIFSLSRDFTNGTDNLDLFIGTSSAGAAPLDGILDETRFSSVARSAAWIKTDYHSLFNTLLTYGSEEVLAVVGAAFLLNFAQ